MTNYFEHLYEDIHNKPKIQTVELAGKWICPDCGHNNSDSHSACEECATVNPDWEPDEERDS